MGVPKATQCTTNKLKGECEEKDGTTGQESQKASYGETGTIASDEFRHFGSSGCCKKNAESRFGVPLTVGGIRDFLARREDHLGWFPLLNRYIGRADDRQNATQSQRNRPAHWPSTTWRTGDDEC